MTEKVSTASPSTSSSPPTSRCASARLPLELVEERVVDAREQVELAQELAHPGTARYSWTKCTAIEPSPTADATRFIDSLRTSPATNTPGMLVSSR